MNIDTMSLENVWEEIDRIANENSETIKEVNSSFNFEITGDNDVLYGLTFNEGTATVTEGGVAGADCTLTMNEKNFKKLLQGQLNSTTAFMTGRLKVKGNIGLALKLENVLKKLSFN